MTVPKGRKKTTDTQRKPSVLQRTVSKVLTPPSGDNQTFEINSILRAINRSSHAMIRAVDETAYAQEVCQIIVENCGYPMVWVGFAENDQHKSVRPVASAGFEEGYLETLNITWADTERGRGPTGTAIRTGQPSRCANMQTDAAFKPWRKEAVKRGYASSLVLPLKNSDDRAFGAISIYAKEPNAFTDEEEMLLTELANDTAYGIEALRLRAAHARAEEEIKNLAKFPEENPFPVLRLAADGTVLYSNSPGQTLLDEWRCGVGKKMPAKWQSLIKTTMGSNRYQVEEVPCGEKIFLITIAPVAQAGYVNLYGRDITKLRESEQQFRAIFEGNTDGLLVTDDLSQKFLMCNDAICRMLGYSRDEINNLMVADIHPEEDVPFVRQQFEHLASGKIRVVSDIPVQRKDGSIFFADISASRIMLSGKPYLVGSFRDVTERKEAAAALHKAEQANKFLAGLIRNASQPVAVGYPDGRLGMINTAFEQLTGYSAEELKTMDWVAELTPPQWRDFERQKLDDLHRTGKPVRYEKEYIRKDDTLVPIELLVHVVKDAEGSPQFYYSFITDITERKQAEERAKGEQQETEFSNRILQVFVEHEGDELFAKALAIVQEVISSRHGVFGYIAEPGHLICPSLSKMLDACEVKGKCIHYPPEKWKGLWAKALTEKRSLYTNDVPPVPPGHPIIYSNLAAPIPVIMHAEDGQVLQLSRTWTELTGYEMNEIRSFDEWTTQAVYGEGADKVRDYLKGLFSSSSSSSSILSSLIL